MHHKWLPYQCIIWFKCYSFFDISW